jgi:ankyrin repeat protein
MRADKKNVFHYLSSSVNLAALEELFGKEQVQKSIQELINESSENQNSPLMTAIQENRLNSISLLLKLGAKIDQEHKGLLPLHLACIKPSDAIAQLLLEKGADPLQQLKGQTTPLEFAAKKDREDLISLMLTFVPEAKRMQAAQETFLYALKEKSHAVIPSLLALGVDVHKVDDELLPLHNACFYADDKIAHLLLEKGADPLRQPEGRISPLEFAVKKDRADLVEKMLAFVPEIQKAKAIQETFFYALNQKVHAVIPLLLKLGADVHEADDGLLPLHGACYYSDDKIAQLILEKGADPLRRLEEKITPLELAIKKDRADLVEKMLAFVPEIQKAKVIQETFFYA